MAANRKKCRKGLSVTTHHMAATMEARAAAVQAHAMGVRCGSVILT